MPPKKLKRLSEKKTRYHLYRMSQSPQEQENRFRGERVRWQSKISSESNEIHDERVKNNKILKINLRDEFSDEIPAENIIVFEMPQKMSIQNLVEKDRLREYRSSQSPLERDNRLDRNRVRMEINRSFEGSEIRAKRLDREKILMRNSRVKSSNEVSTENISSPFSESRINMSDFNKIDISDENITAPIVESRSDSSVSNSLNVSVKSRIDAI